MAPRRLYLEDGLDSLRDEMIYTEGRLLFDENAKDQATRISELINGIDLIRQGQLDCWRAETLAQSHIDAINYRHDVRTLRLGNKLRSAVNEDPREQRRYQRYFPMPPSKLSGLSLVNQLKLTRGYPQSLATEPEEDIRAFSAGFLQDVTQADEALREQAAAATARKDYRTRNISALFDTANDIRLDLHAVLSGRILALGLPRDYADSFFRAGRRGTPSDKDPASLKRAAIYAIFLARGFTLSEESKTRLNNEEDLTVLDLWLSRAATLASPESAFV